MQRLKSITESISTIRLDSVIVDTEHRLSERQQQALKIDWLIPSNLCSSSLSMEEQWKQLQLALDLFIALFHGPRIIRKIEFNQ